MNATVVLTVALIASGAGQARLAEPLGALLHPGDVAHVFYALRIGGELRTVEAGTARVTESTPLETLVEVAPGSEIKAGYRARFEIPIARLSSADLAWLTERSTEPPTPGEPPESRQAAGMATPEDEALEEGGLDGPALSVLEAWRSAWQGQDVTGYLACYSENFEPEDGSTLEAWREIRRRRLTAPAFIEVELTDVAVEPVADNTVRLTFRQTFRSDGFSDVVRKQLVMVHEDAGWRIREERSLP